MRLLLNVQTEIHNVWCEKITLAIKEMWELFFQVIPVYHSLLNRELLFQGTEWKEMEATQTSS